jgi:hypothetical protein
MKQTPAKKQRTKAPAATPQTAEQPQQQYTPIDIMRGVVHQFDKLQQEHAKLVEQYTIVAYALAIEEEMFGCITVSEKSFRETLSAKKVTINPVIEDGFVSIQTSLQPL